MEAFDASAGLGEGVASGSASGLFALGEGVALVAGFFGAGVADSAAAGFLRAFVSAAADEADAKATHPARMHGSNRITSRMPGFATIG